LQSEYVVKFEWSNLLGVDHPVASASLTDTLLERRPGSLRAKLDELRTFAVSRLTKIRELLSQPEDIAKLHELLAEQLGSITLEPVTENGKRTYLAHGKVDFFGEEALVRTGGAGGQNGTMLPQSPVL